MAIESTPFGRTVLSGADAAEFLRVMRDGRPNPLAQETLRLGRSIFESMKRYERTRCPSGVNEAAALPASQGLSASAVKSDNGPSVAVDR